MRSITLIVTVAGILLAITASARDIIVSPGDSLTRARDTAKAGDRVVLHGGTYPLTEPLVLGPQNSGVTWTAATGETPVLSGGRTVTNWVLHDSKRNIWKATVTDTDNFRQLYINGIKAVRACSNGNPGLKKSPTGFTTPDVSLQSYGNISDMEVVASPRPWTQNRLPIAAIHGNAITIQEPCWTNLNARPHHGAGTPVRLENAYELMRNPGHWYLNRHHHTLYYIPRSGENMNTAIVEIPVLEQLITLAGSAVTPVHGVHFVGLTFRLTNWLQPSTNLGLQSGQANQGVALKAALDCTGAQHANISGCTFQQLGGNGLNLLTASRNDTVDGCIFRDIAAGAVQVGCIDATTSQLPPESGDIVVNIVVSNCTIHHVATDYQSSCAVFFGYTRACTITHNEICNVPYSGISLGWGWTNAGARAAYTRGNRILFNKIHDHMQVLADGGAIYCNGYQEGGLIKGNHVYNQGHNYALLYLDDGAANWTVTSNVCQGASREHAWYLYKGVNNHASHNFTDHSFVHIRNTGPCTVSDTTVVTTNVWPAEAVAIINSAGPTQKKPL